jgi:hypothetical protein
MLTTPEWLGVGWMLYQLTKPSPAQVKATVAKVDAKLLARANQPAAQGWFGVLTQADGLDLPPDIAEAVCRWFGLESSGDPLAVSTAGERTLAQITKTSALTEGALTQAEWDGSINPALSPHNQAALGWKVIEWCWARAKKYIPGGQAHDAIDQLWYAKMYHQRPVDVRDGKMTGFAMDDSHRLEQQWANDPTQLHGLHAADVVAWNTLVAP